MGRWGTAIYSSDTALDYLATITDLFERELAYWMAPENVAEEGHWLGNVFAVLELIFLFQHREPSLVFLNDKRTAIPRWRETILAVWDGNWQIDGDYPYDQPDFRKQHRPTVIQIFDHLDTLSRYWSESSEDDSEPEYPFPFFSGRSINKEYRRNEAFVHNVSIHLEKDIIYRLSPEKRKADLSIEEIWGAVDLLGLISEGYERSPGVDEEVVRRWQNTTLQFYEDDVDAIELYPDVINTFNYLTEMARKYPPIDW